MDAADFERNEAEKYWDGGVKPVLWNKDREVRDGDDWVSDWNENGPFSHPTGEAENIMRVLAHLV